MTFNVRLMPRAEQDLNGILAWLYSRSPQGAATWYARWVSVIESLQQIAPGCGLAPEDVDHEAEIRQIIFKTRRGKPYRAIFTIRGSDAFVLHIRGWGQDLIRGDDLALPSDEK